MCTHHCLNSRTFLSPGKKLCAHYRRPCLFSPQQPLIYFLCLDFPILDISCKCSHIICALLCLASFTYCNVFKVNPCFMYYYIPFHGWIIFHYMSMLHFVDGHLGCLHFLTILNTFAINIHVQAFVWMNVFSSLGCIPRSGILGSNDNCLRNYHIFSKVASTSRIWGFRFLYILANIYLSFWLLPSYWWWNGMSLQFWFAFCRWLKMLSIFSRAYWPFAYLWRNVNLITLPIFKTNF